MALVELNSGIERAEEKRNKFLRLFVLKVALYTAIFFFFFVIQINPKSLHDELQNLCALTFVLFQLAKRKKKKLIYPFTAKCGMKMTK